MSASASGGRRRCGGGSSTGVLTRRGGWWIPGAGSRRGRRWGSRWTGPSRRGRTRGRWRSGLRRGALVGARAALPRAPVGRPQAQARLLLSPPDPLRWAPAGPRGTGASIPQSRFARQLPLRKGATLLPLRGTSPEGEAALPALRATSPRGRLDY